jgi:spore coat polysaccharide biosynthesis predicted glycosyltransferase SpsG/RimJ/RimL family protein N-acetyltransferase
MKPRAAFSFDVGPDIGEGHRIRSKALADWLKDDFEILFPDEGTPVDLLVLDGYGFSSEWIRRQQPRASCILQIVDTPSGPYVADAIVNPSHDASPSTYPAFPHTAYRLGSRFRLLRREFLSPIPTQPREGIWFAPGGTDSARLSAHWIPWLIHHQPEPIRMALTSSAHDDLIRELNQFQSEFPERFKLCLDADAETIVKEMDASRIAICTASGVFWEITARHLPVAVGFVADNQTHVYEQAVNRWGAHDLGDMRQLSSSRIQDVLAQPQAITLDTPMDVATDWSTWCASLLRVPRLRPATMADAQTLYDWTMDPIVRSQSLNSGPFPFAHHKQWLESKLSSADCRLFIGEWHSVPCGMIRFDRMPTGHWKLNYLLAADHRGKGLAKGLVTGGMRAMHGLPLLAQVKPENTASLKVFRSAGWTEQLHDGLHHFRTHSDTTE